MKGYLAAVLILFSSPVWGETPEEWIALGARVHGAFGAFIPLGIRIGLDASERLKAQPRELSVTYYDSDKSPCACFADGIATVAQAGSADAGEPILLEVGPGATLSSLAAQSLRGRRIPVIADTYADPENNLTSVSYNVSAG